jgi:hypothetical protein
LCIIISLSLYIFFSPGHKGCSCWKNHVTFFPNGFFQTFSESILSEKLNVTTRPIGVFVRNIFLSKLGVPTHVRDSPNVGTVVKGPQMGFIVFIRKLWKYTVGINLKLTLPLSRPARPFIVRKRDGHVTKVGVVM